MLTGFIEDGYRFFFYSREGSPREPVHVHVIKKGCEAKYWIDPEIDFARNSGFKAADLRDIKKILRRRSGEIKEAWRDHFRD